MTPTCCVHAKQFPAHARDSRLLVWVAACGPHLVRKEEVERRNKRKRVATSTRMWMYFNFCVTGIPSAQINFRSVSRSWLSTLKHHSRRLAQDFSLLTVAPHSLHWSWSHRCWMGWGQGSVQARQALPHQTWNYWSLCLCLFLWTWLYAWRYCLQTSANLCGCPLYKYHCMV